MTADVVGRSVIILLVWGGDHTEPEVTPKIRSEKMWSAANVDMSTPDLDVTSGSQNAGAATVLFVMT